MEEENKSEKISIEPIETLVKDKTNKKLLKYNKEKKNKPSWWIRSKRKKLIAGLKEELQIIGIKNAWMHNSFISAEERKAKNIIIYIQINPLQKQDLIVENIEANLDKIFKRKKITLIEISTLSPSIKEFVFKDLSSIF
ncbi:MAG: hypothetical protein LBM25_05875 [Bacteroidales bacterium]|jgi:hypothetical protein|nr:hypothetical protein [Bacteroidales bacterium]